jgi:hypothetical protein
MPQTRSKRRRRGRDSRAGLWTVGLAVAGSLVLGVVLVTMRLGGTGDGSPVAVEPTVLQGAHRAGGVEVDATEVDLGRVPLDRIVSHAFRLRNTGELAVTLGRARIETLEGC